MDEWTADRVLIADYLRKALIDEDSSYYQVFQQQERDTLEFRLFKIICLGGQLCQYEDYLNPYVEMTKLCLSQIVASDESSTLAFAIDGELLFDSKHQKNYCIVTLDLQSMAANVIYQSEACYY